MLHQQVGNAYDCRPPDETRCGIRNSSASYRDPGSQCTNAGTLPRRLIRRI